MQNYFQEKLITMWISNLKSGVPYWLQNRAAELCYCSRGPLTWISPLPNSGNAGPIERWCKTQWSEQSCLLRDGGTRKSKRRFIVNMFRFNEVAGPTKNTTAQQYIDIETWMRGRCARFVSESGHEMLHKY